MKTGLALLLVSALAASSFADSSLTFGAATSDRVDVVPSASINDLKTFTVFVWARVTTLTTGRRLWAKPPTGANRLFQLNGTAGNLQFQTRRTGAALSYITSSTPLSSLNTWYAIALTYDDSLSASAAHIYTSSNGAALTEATYGTATNSSGASDISDAANNMVWGNGGVTGTNSSAWQGQIAVAMLWNRVLTLSELNDQVRNPHSTSGLVDFKYLGFNGTGTQVDLSGNGNAGTVTGATVSTLGPPISIGGRPQ